MTTNKVIREEAKKHHVLLWEVADAWGVSDGQFSRWLRHEFTPEKTAQAMRYIEEIAQAHEAQAAKESESKEVVTL